MRVAVDFGAAFRGGGVVRYLGGKSRHAKAIAAVINPVRAGRALWDPFCGGLASAAAFGGELVCSDVNAGLIAAYREIQSGAIDLAALEALRPSRGLRAAALRADPSDPIATLIRFGTSFGGDVNGGPVFVHRTADGREYDYFAQSMRSLQRQFRTLGAARFLCLDFLERDAPPPAPEYVLYLDPPYPGTTGYGREFDHAAFLVRARAWAAVTDVWVSGYAWPAEAGALAWEAPAGGKRGLPTSGRERLWKVLPP